MSTFNMRPFNMWRHSKLFLSVAAASLTFSSANSYAQSELEEIVVTGIRASLENALAEKRASDNLVEVIIAAVSYTHLTLPTICSV